MFKFATITGATVSKNVVVKTIEEKKRNEVIRNFYALGRNPNAVSPAERRRITAKFEQIRSGK